jgi:two-component system, cell cycle sensor histidine kinase and response regulator CckA
MSQTPPDLETLTASNQNEVIFEAIFESTLQCFILLDRNGKILTMNRAAYLLNYYNIWKEMEVEQKFIEFIQPSVRDSFLQNFQKALNGEVVVLERLSDVNQRWYRYIYTPAKTKNRQIIGVCLNIDDIQERKEAEEALQHSQKIIERNALTAKAILDHSPQAFALVGKNHEILAFNQQFFDITLYFCGIAVTEGDSNYSVLPLDRRLSYEQNFAKALAGETVILDSLSIKDGEEHWFEISYNPVKTGDEVTAAIITYLPIDRRKKTEKDLELANIELMKNSKLEALGILAGGIAHDFNNLLTNILGNISFVSNFAGQLPPEIKESLKGAEEACERAKGLTQQLLTFSKGGAPVRKAAKIKEIIQDSANFVLHGSKVQAEYYLPDDLWTVEVDAGQVSQVVQNLVLNAVQAMPAGGKIKISAQNISNAERPPKATLLSGNYIEFSIEDSGKGISPEHLSRVFDPYFTTKANGNGLGLAICYSIIAKHDGNITVESKLHEGTIFNIYLPAYSEKAVADTVNARKKDWFPAKQNARILIMDDDVSIRKFLKKSLEKFGYTVETAEDGDEAIELYKSALYQNQRFDAVVMDLTIPGGKGGRETIQDLRKIDPHIRAVVSSGYANNTVMANYQDFGFSGLVSKPYRLEDILHVLDQVLQI